MMAIKQHPRPELGSWHTITERAVKQYEGDKRWWESEIISDLDYRKGTWKTDRETCIKEFFPEIITEYRAMYIGYRYKKNGWVLSYEHPVGVYERWLAPDETVEIWLFITHENRKPVEVFPFPIEPKS